MLTVFAQSLTYFRYGFNICTVLKLSSGETPRQSLDFTLGPLGKKQECNFGVMQMRNIQKIVPNQNEQLTKMK